MTEWPGLPQCVFIRFINLWIFLEHVPHCGVETLACSLFMSNERGWLPSGRKQLINPELVRCIFWLMKKHLKCVNMYETAGMMREREREKGRGGEVEVGREGAVIDIYRSWIYNCNLCYHHIHTVCPRRNREVQREKRQNYECIQQTENATIFTRFISVVCTSPHLQPPHPNTPRQQTNLPVKISFPFGYGCTLCDASALFFFHNINSSVSFWREVTEGLRGAVWVWLYARPPILKHFGLHKESF